MQTTLTRAADVAARASGFTKRRSKLTGSFFAQTLVFGWLANPEATLEELCQAAAAVGVRISPQGLDARFNAEAAECLKQVLETAISVLIASSPVAVPLLERFDGVHIVDSSTIVLPEALGTVWRGCGGSTAEGTQAALKLQVCLDLSSGAMLGPMLQDGRAHDTDAPVHTQPLARGVLRVTDLGYWNLDWLRDTDAQGAYWLSRLHPKTAVLDRPDLRLDLIQLLRDCVQADIPVLLGNVHQLPARLLAVRVPQQVADQRRRRIRAEARRKGRSVSKQRLALCAWTMLVTNVPAERLSLEEALVLARARWQIELLFKLWKGHGRIDESRSAKPWRVLCEVYAKLLAMLVQHWLFLVSCWQYPDRSLHKAAHTVRKLALYLASVFGSTRRLRGAIYTIQHCLACGCRINKRKARPHTYQLLLAVEA